MALERQLGLPRGTLLSTVTHGESVIERLLSATMLERATLQQLARILTVTARDWAKK